MTALRRTNYVPRSSIIVDHTRNVSRGGHPIDPTADATLELALTIDREGQREPVSVRKLEPTDTEPRDLRLVYGFRRITAMDVLREDPHYPVFVVYSDAKTDLDEALENCVENLTGRMPSDSEIGEGICAMRDRFRIPIDAAVDRIFAQEGTEGTTLMHTRAKSAANAWSVLTPSLRTLWRKNTPIFRLKDAVSIWEAHMLPEEQEDYLRKLLEKEEVRRQRRAVGLPEDEPTEKPKRPKLRLRPQFNTMVSVYNSLNKGPDDEHEDGLPNDQVRDYFRLFHRWYFALTDQEGNPARCPIRLRDTKKRTET